MNVKISFVVGVDAVGNPHQLYLGTDGEAAKQAYTDAVNGGAPAELNIETVSLFIRPTQDRRHDVVKSEPGAGSGERGAGENSIKLPTMLATKEEVVTETVASGETEDGDKPKKRKK